MTSSTIKEFKQRIEVSIRERACVLKAQAVRGRKTESYSSGQAKMMTANIMLLSVTTCSNITVKQL